MIFALVLTSLLAILVAKIIVLPYLRVKHYAKYKGAHSHFLPLVGLFYRFESDATTYKDSFYIYKDWANQNYKPRFVVTNFKTRAFIIIIDPKLTKKYYQFERYYEKELNFFGYMRDLLGNSIFISEGKTNKQRRLAITKVLHFDFLKPFIPHIVKIVNREYNSIEEKGLDSVEILPAVANVSGETIVSLYLGESVLSSLYKGHSMPNYLRMMFTDIGVSMKSPYIFFLGPQLCKKLGFLKHLTEDIKGFREHCRNIVKEKRKKYEARGRVPNHEMIELLWKEIEENPNPHYDEDAIMEDYLGLFLGGLSNSTHFIQMMYYHLATNPKVVEKLREESKRIFKDGSSITLEEIHRMDYTQAFIKETIRVKTPVPMIVPRVVTQDHYLDDLQMKKGTLVAVDLYHRMLDPNEFEDPLEFRPERWLENPGIKDPFNYIPFSAGYTGCIGQHVAQVEAKILVAEFVQRYDIKLKDGYDLKMGIKMFHQPLDPLTFTLTKRR